MVLPLLQHQFTVWTAVERHIFLGTGLGGGKTWLGARWIIREALTAPKDAVLVVTINSYPQAMDVVMPEVDRALDDFGVHATWHDKKGKDFKFWQIRGGAKILLRSTHDPDKQFRGLEIDRLWADEGRDMAEYASKVLWTRMRGRRMGDPKSLWTTSPNGYDHLYRRFIERGKEGRDLYVHATSDDNPCLTADYLEILDTELTDLERKQEKEGLFVDLTGVAAYHQWQRSKSRRPCPFDPAAPAYLCVDFNYNPLAWVLVQQHVDEAGHTITRCVREFTARGAVIEMLAAQVAEYLHAQVDKSTGLAWTQRFRLVLNGDATGTTQKNRQTAFTDVQALVKALKDDKVAVDVDMPRSNPTQRDRVRAVNARCKDGKTGKTYLWLDPDACPELGKDLDSEAWGPDGRLDDAKGLRGHWSAALGYHCWKHHPLILFDRTTSGKRWSR